MTTATTPGTLDPPREQPGRASAPRWATRLAHVIPFLVLPSGLWRLAATFGFSVGQLDNAGHPAVMRGWAAVYIAIVSLFAETTALTAFGLVQPIGHEIPRWSPLFAGRSVRPRVVVAVGTIGSIALMLIWTVGFWPAWVGANQGFATSHDQAVFTACYAPLNLWGPALLVLTWAYRRRARRAETESD